MAKKKGHLILGDMAQFEATQKKYEATGLPRWGSLASIKRLVGKNKTVLDVGCASGYLGALLMKEGNIVYGIDGNKDAIEIAKKHYRKAMHYDLNTADKDHLTSLFDGITFDTIIFADVLEHLLDPEAALLYFITLLKPNGKIIVSLPNVALWRVRANLLFGNFNYTDYGVLDRTHLHLYTFKTAKEMVRNSGLRIVSEYSALNFYPFGVLVAIFPFLKNILAIHIIIEAEKI